MTGKLLAYLTIKNQVDQTNNKELYSPEAECLLKKMKKGK